MGKVTIIPSTLNPLTQMPIGAVKKRRVAAYARVSTDSDEQFTSYEAQVKVYTEMIRKNPEWEFVDVYSDEGITGTNRKKRDGFNRMIQDCYDGKIDLIITKSISRFARNTLDAVGLSRELKKKRNRGVLREGEPMDLREHQRVCAHRLSQRSPRGEPKHIRERDDGQTLGDAGREVQLGL